MLTLVSEKQVRITIAAGGTGYVQAPLVRPRTQGGVQPAGQTYNAIYADSPTVRFYVLPADGEEGFDELQALLRVYRYPQEGGMQGAQFETDFPTPAQDVSGVLSLAEGLIEVDLSKEGTAYAQLELVNRGSSALNVRGLVTVFAEPTPRVIRHEEGVFPTREVPA